MRRKLPVHPDSDGSGRFNTPWLSISGQVQLPGVRLVGINFGGRQLSRGYFDAAELLEPPQRRFVPFRTHTGSNNPLKGGS